LGEGVVTTYRERREARADRLGGWAAKRDAKTEAGFKQAHTMADAIPFGQPILSDHYSAKGDRSYRARMRATGERALTDSNKAREMASKAANIRAAAEHAIYSDDPDAIERLEGRIAALEAKRDRIKAYNASCRKGSPDESLLDDSQRAGLATSWKFQRSYMERRKGQMPAYVLSNLSGNIAQQRKRLAQLREA
jgi:hypothetical protein